jgi:hypothetical protein
MGSNDIPAQPKGKGEAKHSTNTHTMNTKWGPTKGLEHIATAQVAGKFTKQAMSEAESAAA